MLRNYIKIAFRNLWHYKGYSLINILGLTLGITCSSLLFLLIADELQYDSHYEQGDNIYRLVEIDESTKETRYYGMTTPAVAPALEEDYGEVARCIRLFQFGGHINFQIDDERYHERQYFFADPDVFDVFEVEWITGNPQTALEAPNSLVIDEDWAMRWFGTLDVVGNEVMSRDRLYEITGVFKKLPQNTHLQFKILAALPTFEEWFPEYIVNWRTYGAYTYVLLNVDASIETLSAKIPEFIDSHFEKEQERNFYLQPLSDIHFGSQNIEYASDTNRGQISYIYILIAVGVFMLVIACINYVNLATAKSMHRGKEIGIRKVSGAYRGQLVLQLLSESVLIALVSFILSVGLVDLLIPQFNVLTGKAFDMTIETFGELFILLLGVTLFVGLIAGLYPALFISRLKPSNILRGDMNKGRGGAAIRKSLVVLQFTLSIIMIIATIITSNQLRYIQESNLGFDQSNMLVVDINNGDVRQRSETIRSEFEKSPYVSAVAVSSRVPGEWKTIQDVYVKEDNSEDSTRVNYIGFDENMLETYGMQLKAGRNFSGNTKSDSTKIIVNETFVNALGLADPIGKSISIVDGEPGWYEIIGIVKDFNFQSMHNEIGPIILGYQSNAYQVIDYFSLKFDPEYTEEVVAHATAVHNRFDTSSPIEYHFLDAQWQEFYKLDRQLSQVFAVGAGITIFIACLGLLGLATFIIQKRNKELSIRKVLGADVSNLMLLVSKTFMQQIVVAFLIAAPLAYYLMNQWLDNFAYQTTIGAGVFIIALVASLSIAMLTIAYQVIKASTVNPVDKLRDE